jgi:hypothetical protein
MGANVMDKRHLTAPCGLDCFNCPAYKTNLPDEKKNEIAASQKITPDEVGCKGCRDQNGRCWFMKETCATWTCTRKKGALYCYACDEFPCGLLAPTEKGANYPHNMKVYNLCRMKIIGVDGWIEESANIRERYYNGTFVVGKGPVLEEE